MKMWRAEIEIRGFGFGFAAFICAHLHVHGFWQRLPNAVFYGFETA